MRSPEKPTLVMVPGLGATGAIYEPLLKPLRSVFNVRYADHPLVFPPKLSWSFFFGSIDRALAGKPGYLVGHSMGGAIALKYAASHPERAKRVVAIAPPLFPTQPGREWKGLNRRLWYRYFKGFLIGITSSHWLHLLRTVRIRWSMIADNRRARLYEWSTMIDLARDLAKLRRAIVLWPKNEEVIDPRTLERLKRDFRNIPVKIVPGSHNHAALSPRKLTPIIREQLGV